MVPGGLASRVERGGQVMQPVVETPYDYRLHRTPPVNSTVANCPLVKSATPGVGVSDDTVHTCLALAKEDFRFRRDLLLLRTPGASSWVPLAAGFRIRS